MSVQPGSKIGPYEIVAAIGAGGMGEVYRARDSKLARDVAVKILSATFASDPDRLARFRREAQVLASLNHPNIGHIYGLEDAPSTSSGQGGVQALVLELVEGPTLADRIAQGPLPVEETVAIARQIADALESAHEHGVVHRDLKPANVKVRDDGTVKVLDFGLAKALDPGASSAVEALNSPTLTGRATQMGVILGTAAYMSPEQAKGKTVDRRADIWAFGAVLYEMLTGRRAFDGDDVSDTLASVLRQDVNWGTLPATTPPALRRLIARCLERDVRKRLRDIGEARILLEDPATAEMHVASAPTLTSAPVAVTTRSAPWRRAGVFAAAVILASSLGAAVAWYLRPAATSPVVRFTIPLREAESFGGGATIRHLLAISPDGSHIAFTATSGLFVRSLADFETRLIASSDAHGGISSPAFSPDGRSIAFYALGDRTLKRIAVAGGPVVTIGPWEQALGIHWSSDDIVFGDREGIMRVSPAAGKPVLIVPAGADETLQAPQLLPGGRQVMFTVARGNAPDRWERAAIVVRSLTSDEPATTIVEPGANGVLLANGSLAYASAGNLLVAPFDANTRRITGDAALAVDGVRRATGPATSAAQFAAARNGTLTYITGPAAASLAGLDLALMDRSGAVVPLKLSPASYGTPRVSPDGKRIAVAVESGTDAHISIVDISGGVAPRRLTFGGNNRLPIWTADGLRIAFQSDREGDRGIFWQLADGTGPAERLTRAEAGESHSPDAWSPSGDIFLFTLTKEAKTALWSYSLTERKATAFGDVRGTVPPNPVFSPDGRWVAYVNYDGPRSTIFVQPFPATGARFQMPVRGSDGPHEVTWSPTGKELFYNPRPGGFEAIAVTTTTNVSFGTAVSLPRPIQLGPPAAPRAYDVLPDGRFIGLVSPGQTTTGAFTDWELRVVLNWFDELKRAAPAR